MFTENPETLKMIEDRLLLHPFLENVPTALIQELVPMASAVTFEPGEMILNVGEAANRFYLIDKGKVSIEIDSAKSGDIYIQSIGEGDVLGWSWLTSDKCWEFDARAVEYTQAIALKGEWLRQLMADNHELGYLILMPLLNVVAGRLKSTRIQYWDIYKMHYLMKGGWK